MRGYTTQLNSSRFSRAVCAGPPRTNPDIMLASGNVSIEKRHRESDRVGAGIKSRGRVFAHVLHRRPDLFADSKLCRTMHPFRSRIIKWEKRNLYGCPFVGSEPHRVCLRSLTL